MKLNRKWAIAILMAALELTMAARNALMVVPMFAPMMNGMALRRRTTFLATRGTTSEVVTVLERIAAVVRKPQPNDFQAFRKKNC